jgi:hypothetical protein
MDSLHFLILILNLCIINCICIKYGLFEFTYFNSEFIYFLINVDLQIFIKSNGVYSSIFWINVRILGPSQRTW